MNPVFSAIKETILYWGRFFLPLMALTIVTVAPIKLLFGSILASHHQYGFYGIAALGFGDIILKSIQESALLGLILFPLDGGSIWQSMRKGIFAGWVPFVVINTVLTFLMAGIVDALIISLFQGQISAGNIQFVVWLTLIVTVLGYAKFGLALPVIVAEQLSLWGAFKRAWFMTRGDLIWIVILSFVFFRAISTMSTHFTGRHFVHGQLPSLAHQLALDLLQAQVDCLFLILLGVIYKQFVFNEKLSALFAEHEALTEKR